MEGGQSKKETTCVAAGNNNITSLRNQSTHTVYVTSLPSHSKETYHEEAETRKGATSPRGGETATR